MAIRRTKVSSLLPLAVFLTAVPALGGYEPHQYVEPGTGLVLEYNLYVPDGYDSSKKYPLLVFLHAAGGTLPRTLSSSGKGWTGSFLDNGDAEKYPSFFLIPISQTNESGWGDGLSDTPRFEGRLTIDVLKQLLASGQYNIDAERLYLTGPSMGGRGTWDMIEKNPGLFAAAVPCAAPGLDQFAAVIHENIWSVNGEKDSTVGDNRATIEGIRAAGGNPIYTELAGHGHDTWRSIYPTDAFMSWMYAQRRGVPWWNVSSVPKVDDALTPGQVVVAGPSQPTSDARGGSGGSAGTSMLGSGAGGATNTSGMGGMGRGASGGAAGMPSLLAGGMAAAESAGTTSSVTPLTTGADSAAVAPPAPRSGCSIHSSPASEGVPLLSAVLGGILARLGRRRGRRRG